MLNHTLADETYDTDPYENSILVQAAKEMSRKVKSGQLETLNIRDCIDAYAQQFVTSRGNLFLVSADNESLPGVIEYIHSSAEARIGCPPNPFYWICGHVDYLCDTTPCSEGLEEIRENPVWSPFGKPVTHCLSETLPQQCRLDFTPTVAWVVIVFNAIKAAVLIWTVVRVNEDVLVTIGDTIRSFLHHGDETTRSRCLLDHRRMKSWRTEPAVPRIYDEGMGKKRWSETVSLRRRNIAYAL